MSGGKIALASFIESHANAHQHIGTSIRAFQMANVLPTAMFIGFTVGGIFMA